MTFNKKEAGYLTTREKNSATSSFADGVFHIYGSVVDVNKILTDIIFVPNMDYSDDFELSLRIKNSNNEISGKVEFYGQF